MSHEPVPEHARLAALVGRWRTQGQTRATAETPAATIDAVDTYDGYQGALPSCTPSTLE